MFKVKLNNALWLLSTVATVLLLDYGAKLLAKVLLKGQQPVSFLQDMLILVYAENMGAMLSAGHSLNEELRAFVFIGLVSAALSIWTIWLMTRESEILLLISSALIIGGGFGNVISRALNNGAVVDFVYIDFGLVSTGIFNIADIAIITGVMMLFAYQFNKNRPDN